MVIGVTLLTNLGKLIIRTDGIYYVDKTADIKLKCTWALPYTNPNDFIGVLMNDNNYVQLVMIGNEIYIIEITPDDMLCYIIPRNQLFQLLQQAQGQAQGDINEQ